MVAPAWADSRVALRLLETTDIHMFLTDDDFLRDHIDPSFGLARTATLIAQARKEAANSLLLDAGDLIEGNPMGDTAAAPGGLPEGVVHPAYRLMNLLGYDAATLGNHEFNYGIDFLVRAMQGAQFPIVSANVVGEKDGAAFLPPYVILERQLLGEDGKRHLIHIGILGLVTPQIVVWDHDHVKGRLTTKDIAETASLLVPEIRRKGANIVVALVHSGWSSRAPRPLEENAVGQLSKIAGIDAILFGHTHLAFPSASYDGRDGADLKNGTIYGVPATQGGYWGSHLGIVDLDLEVSDDSHWHVLGGKGSARPIARRDNGKMIALVEPDQTLLDAVAGERQATIRRLSEALGETARPLNSFFAYLHPDPIGDLIAKAQSWYIQDMLKGSAYAGLPVLSAAAPFKAGGRMGIDNFTDIAAGPLSVKSLADAYPYPNTIQAVLLNGDQIVEWLEMAAQVFNKIDANKTEPQPLFNGNIPSYNFDTLYGGLAYAIDVSKPPRYAGDGTLIHPDSHRISEVRWQGRPLKADDRFVIACSNYRASGGGHVPGLDGSTVIFSGADETRKVMGAYIHALGVVGQTQELPWHLTGIPASATVIYDTSPKAVGLAQADPALQPIGQSDGGFARFRVLGLQ